MMEQPKQDFVVDGCGTSLLFCMYAPYILESGELRVKTLGLYAKLTYQQATDEVLSLNRPALQ